MSLKPKTFTYKEVANCNIKADLYLPAETFGLSPVIFWLHGGALIEGSRKWIHSKQIEIYTKAGFALLAIDYRLAPETLLPEMMFDIDDAYTWLLNELAPSYHLNPDHVCVVGHSAGGFLAFICGYRLQPTPKAIVSFYGYCDIAGDWSTKVSPYFQIQRQVTTQQAYEYVGESPISEGQGFRQNLYTYCRQHGIIAKVTGGFDPLLEPEQCRPYNPIENVNKSYPPTLLIHGKQDRDVPIEQSELMAGALSDNGIANRLIRVERARHLFDNKMDDAQVVQVFDDVIAFLQ